MKVVVRLFAAALLLVAERTFVSPSPVSNQDDSRRFGLFPNSAVSNKDQDVKDLERLKPVGGSFSLMKSHSKVYTNINGKEKEMSQTKEEVDKDGNLLAKVEQNINKNNENIEPQITTSLDIPAQNIHQIIRNRPNIMQKADMENRGLAGLQYSPADMADYIFWTGDERGVTSAIEDYLQEGMMSRSDAIEFLQEIKKNLELMQNQFIERGEIIKDRYDDRNVFSKKSLQEPYGGTGVLNNPGVNMVASMIPEDDYEDLMEKLKMSDSLFNEYSLEEVIYQLAKVMFTQSLSRGSVEAQDALTKVTGFLDLEAQQGKITRNMEKKVLSVLISALSDTLTEHPELVNTARESLGIPQPEPLVHRLFPQGQLKLEEELPKGHKLLGKQGQNMKRTIQDSGLKDDDNKH